MLPTLNSVFSLLLGMGVLLAGSGLLGTLLGLRATLEGFAEFTVGLIMSAFFAGYIVGSYLCPLLIRRVGHIRTFAALAAASAVVALLHGMWLNAWVWGLLRLINGICILGLYMVVESWLSEQVVQRRVQVFAVYMMVSLAAMGAGQFLIAIYGPGDLASFALVALLFCLGLIPLALTRRMQPVVTSSGSMPLRQLYNVSPVGATGALTSGLLTGAFWGLMAVYGLNIGLGSAGAAALVGATIFGGAVLQWPIGLWSDRIDRRVMLVRMTLAAALMAALIHLLNGRSLAGLLVLGTLYGGFSFSLYALSVSHTHDRMQAVNTMAATRGLLLLNGIGATLGPLFIGALMQLIHASVFPLFLALLLVGMAVYARHRIKLDPAVPAEERGDFVPLTRTSPVAMELDPRADQESPTPPLPPEELAEQH